MVLQLTDKELLNLMEKSLQEALHYHALKMYDYFVRLFYEALNYQGLYYSLGYSSDDLPLSIAGLFDMGRNFMKKLAVTEIITTTYSSF